MIWHKEEGDLTMSTPITLEELQEAIERLRPELPTLLGMDYPTFAAELDSYLHMGSP